ncbi:MAG: histidine phosphatase family protein [Bacillota bacterium]
MKLILTRHGETEWNLMRKTQGATDTALTETGREQARLLARRLRGIKIDVIYASCMSRAMETAHIIAHEVGAPVVSEPDLKEYGFGLWEGQHIDSLKDNYPDIFKVWECTPALCRIPGAEDFPSYSRRIGGFLEKALKHHKNGTVMAVSHQLTSKLLITNGLGISDNFIHSFRVDNTSLNILNFLPEHVVLEKLNDTTHLLGEDK